MSLLAFAWTDVAYASLSVFLLAVGLGLGYAFVRLAGALASLASLIRGTERELLPVLNKAGGSLDRVNKQLDKVDLMTDSAVDAVENVDSAVRAASFAVRRPVQKLAGLTAGIAHGASTFKARRDWRAAMRVAREAAARREADLEEELRVKHSA
jgi:uncharacterized protein YoxC